MLSRGEKAAAAILTGHVGFAVVQLVASVAIARVLAPEGRGELAFVMVVSTLAGQICEIGGEQAAMQIRNFDATRDPLTIPSLWWCIGGSGLITVVVVALRGEQVVLSLAAGVFAASIVLARFLLGILTQDNRNVLVAVLRCVPPIALLGVSVVMFEYGRVSVLAIAVALTFANLLSVGVAAVSERRSRRRLTVDGSSVQTVAVNILALQTANIGVVLLYRVDQVLLGFLASSGDLGLYVVAVNLSEVLQYVPVVGATLLLTRNGRGRRKIWVASLTSVAVGAGILIPFGPRVLELLYGHEFGGAADLILPLTIASAAFAVARLAWGELLVARRYWAFAACTAGTAMAFMPVWALGIASDGSRAAAFITACAYGALAASTLALWQLGRRRRRRAVSTTTLGEDKCQA